MSRIMPLLSLCLALGAFLFSPSASARDSGPPSDTPPLEILHVETDEFFADVVTPNGQVLYARTAAMQDGGDDGWWLRMDVQVLNTGPAPLTIIGFELDTDASFPDYTPSKTALNHGYGHIYIQTAQNDWFLNHDTERLRAFLTELCQEKESCSVGFSMGGFGAWHQVQRPRARLLSRR